MGIVSLNSSERTICTSLPSVNTGPRPATSLPTRAMTFTNSVLGSWAS